MILCSINLDNHKIIHKNKCEDGKTITSEARIKSLNEISILHNYLDFSIALEEFINVVMFNDLSQDPEKDPEHDSRDRCRDGCGNHGDERHEQRI